MSSAPRQCLASASQKQLDGRLWSHSKEYSFPCAPAVPKKRQHQVEPTVDNRICKPPSTLRPSNVWYCFFQDLISSQHKSAAFTRAVNCLARYGDELVMCAYPDHFSLSTTNSAKSAYCRFKYEKEFFSRYKAGKRRSEINEDDLNGVQMVTAQLLTKVLIPIYTDILPDYYRTCFPF